MRAPRLHSSWQLKTLKEVAAPIPNAIVDGPFGSNLKLSDYVESGIPVLQGKNITNDTFDWFDIRFISEIKANELKRSSVRVGDILLVKIGSIGYSAIVDSLQEFSFAIIPANLAKITPNPESVDTKYLHHWLTSPSAINYLLSSASKTAQPALSLGKIKELPVPVPPLPEQHRIAAILDQADALRAKRREALAQLDSLTQSIFIEMFGDPKSNPKNWPLQKLEEVTLKITDGEHLNPEFSEEGMPIVMAGNVLEDSIETYFAKKVEIGLGEKFRKKCNPEIGDLLVVSRGATIGRMCEVTIDEKFCLMGSVILLKLHRQKIEPSFLNALLKHPVMRSKLYKTSGSSAQQAIYLKDLKNLVCIVPPITLQVQFAKQMDTISKIKAIHAKSLNELNSLFSSLQHRAFRGEL